jgi:hypothetical protein
MDDWDTKIQERQVDLVNIIEAIDEILKSKAWQTLKELVFDGLVERLEARLLTEAKSDPLNPGLMLKLQGELTMAKRYSDLKSYAEMLTKELQGIKDNESYKISQFYAPATNIVSS